MEKHTLVTTRFTDVFLRSLSSSVKTCDLSEMAERLSSCEQQSFVVPVVGFGTAMASADLASLQERSVCKEFFAEASQLIALYEEFRSNVVIIDIERAGLGSIGANTEVPHWLKEFSELFKELELPAALERLLWAERRAGFGLEVERVFDTLEACSTPLSTNATPHDEEDVTTPRDCYRLFLLHEVKRDMEISLDQARLSRRETALSQKPSVE